MRLIGNLIWWLFGGIVLAIGWALAGLLLTLTVIGIPFGVITVIGIPLAVQHLKLAQLAFMPFGAKIR